MSDADRLCIILSQVFSSTDLFYLETLKWEEECVLS